MRKRGEGRVGRGHCARCFTPTMCANPGCPCHLPKGVVCRFVGCGAGLFVMLPADTRAESALVHELATWAAGKPKIGKAA